MDEVKKPLVAFIAVLVLVISLISIYLTQRRPTPKINMAPSEAVGEVVAEQTVKLLDGTGSVVIIAYQADAPAVSAPVKFFEQALKPTPGITIIGREELTMDPMEAYAHAMMGLPLARFLEVTQKHPTADLIVSFVGAPYLQPGESFPPTSKLPKFVAVATYSDQLKELLQRGFVQAAIVSRWTPPEEPGQEPVTRRDWFDRFYLVVTPENADELPAGL